jgi:hypothetical protein
MSNWRPENWGKIRDEQDDPKLWNPYDSELFEAGADRMLESINKFRYLITLKKDEVMIQTNFPYRFIAPYDGHFAFIPDNSEVEKESK